MQSFIVVVVVGTCALLWIGRLFPKLKNLLWKGLVFFLKISHAPNFIQRWALQHSAAHKFAGCGSCDSCNKCH